MDKLENAIVFATSAHAGMKRKGKTRPYILHPLEAMTIVATITDDEDVLAAAVLHDTIEDTDTTYADIVREFGSRVADLVAAESEDKREDRPSSETWEIRKRETINELEKAGRDVQLICLGDKLSNLREIARDHDALGDSLWSRFNQKDKSKHAWYYGSILTILDREFPGTDAIREYHVLMERVFG